LLRARGVSITAILISTKAEPARVLVGEVTLDVVEDPLV